MAIRNFVRNLFYQCKYLLRLPIYYLNHTCIDSSNKVAEDVSLKHCHIGRYNYFARRDSFYMVKTGNYCCFGPDVHIGGMAHSYWWYSMSPILSERGKCDEITEIGNDVWIAAGCIIKQGVKIGDGAVIGANSFVNKNVPSFAIVAGSPAKIIKYRFDEKTQKRIQESRYWDCTPIEAKRLLNTLSV